MTPDELLPRSGIGVNPAEMAAAKPDRLSRDQAASRPEATELPVSTGPLEQFFNTLGHTIGDRASRMTNKRRVDALLKLLAAHRNGWVNHDRWITIIRKHLEARRGHAHEQRQHTDLRTSPSLR